MEIIELSVVVIVNITIITVLSLPLQLSRLNPYQFTISRISLDFLRYRHELSKTLR